MQILNSLPKKYQLLFVSSLVLIYLISSYNSTGYFHGDEHYQTIEFAGYKLGTHTIDNLAWEFKEKMRPTLQATIAFVILKTFHFLGINNPYTQMFLIRLLTGILALMIISFFVKQTLSQFDTKTKNLYLFLTYFLWYVPFLSVRFSSENWSGILFLWALAYYLKENKSVLKPFILGTLLGFSFLFRFQIIFAVSGFILWLLLIKKTTFIDIVKLGTSFLLIVLVGIVIDSWFYGEIVFTPWFYFKANIIEGAASTFGTEPWYYYFKKILVFFNPVIGFPLLLAFLLLLFFKPKNMYMWIIFPFFLVHILIPHKEYRFLFPLLYLFPIILVLGFIEVSKLLQHRIFKVLITIYFVFALLINTIGLIVMTQKPPGIGRMNITKYIHTHYNGAAIKLIHTPLNNPYNPWKTLPSLFYSEKNMHSILIQDLCDLKDSLVNPNKINLLIVNKAEVENAKCQEQIANNNFVWVKQSSPAWSDYIYKLAKGSGDKGILMLYVRE